MKIAYHFKERYCNYILACLTPQWIRVPFGHRWDNAGAAANRVERQVPNHPSSTQHNEIWPKRKPHGGTEKALVKLLVDPVQLEDDYEGPGGNAREVPDN